MASLLAICYFLTLLFHRSQQTRRNIQINLNSKSVDLWMLIMVICGGHMQFIYSLGSLPSRIRLLHALDVMFSCVTCLGQWHEKTCVTSRWKTLRTSGWSLCFPHPSTVTSNFSDYKEHSSPRALHENNIKLSPWIIYNGYIAWMRKKNFEELSH